MPGLYTKPGLYYTCKLAALLQSLSILQQPKVTELECVCVYVSLMYNIGALQRGGNRMQY
jgi:hypothetical protein